jgi:hypothetical protein
VTSDRLPFPSMWQLSLSDPVLLIGGVLPLILIIGLFCYRWRLATGDGARRAQ